MVAITIKKQWYSQLSKVLARALNRLVSADLRQELLICIHISIQVSIIPRKTGLNYQQIVDILVSTLKVISNIKVTDMFVTIKYIMYYHQSPTFKEVSAPVKAKKSILNPYYVKETKLKRLNLGRFVEDAGGDVDRKLVQEAREAIGYLQLDLTVQSQQNLECGVEEEGEGGNAETA